MVHLHKIGRCVLLAAATLHSFPAYATYAFGKMTEQDKLLLSPVCKLILVEKPSAHQPGGQVTNAMLFEKPEYRMAKGNIHLHHYCYGEIHKGRYFSSKTKVDRMRFLDAFIKDLDYVLTHSPNEWPYFYELHHEQAEMYFSAGDLPKALNKANLALTRQPDFDKSHALISDIYLKQGKKNNAIEQLQLALKANPTSKRLLRRLKALNPTDPLLATAESMTAKPVEEPSIVQKEANLQGPARQDNGEAIFSVETKPTESATMEPQAKPQISLPSEPGPASKQNGNPYCRFCPAP